MRNQSRTMVATALFLLAAAFGWGQGRQRCGMGQQQQGPHRGMAADTSHGEDMELFHFLLDHREEIRRSATDLPTASRP